MTRNQIANIADFILLELRMIRRNKKPLNNLYQILIMYLFSILVYVYLFKSALNNSLTFFMIVSLLSSSFIVGHGLFLLTWESTYFIFIMTRKISMSLFFTAKFILLLISALILSLINIPILYIIGGNIMIYTSFLIFNIGIYPLLIKSIAFFNNERASLARGVFFNYEGYGMWQYILFIFVVMLPGLLYLIIIRFWSVPVAIIIEILLGIFGIVLNMVYPSLFFFQRKYKIIDGFSQK
jgi:hypothetical protein